MTLDDIRTAHARARARWHTGKYKHVPGWRVKMVSYIRANQPVTAVSIARYFGRSTKWTARRLAELKGVGLVVVSKQGVRIKS